MKTRFLAAALFACAAAVPAGAQTLKPGLWEVQQKMGGNPQMDQAMAEMKKQLEAMPPEQRRQMEAMMAQRGVQMAPNAGGGGMGIRMCMTKEMAERNEVTFQQGDCRTTRQEKTGNTLKVAFACNNPPTTGNSEVTMASPEAFSSRTTVTRNAGGKSETTTMEGSGKWLAADCGSVKPVAPPKK